MRWSAASGGDTTHYKYNAWSQSFSVLRQLILLCRHICDRICITHTRSNLRPELRLKLVVMAMQDHYHSPPSASATAREDLTICIYQNNETSTFNCHPSDITPRTHVAQTEEGVSFLGE